MMLFAPLRSLTKLAAAFALASSLASCATWNSSVQLDTGDLVAGETATLIVFSAPQPYVYGARKFADWFGPIGASVGNKVQNEQGQQMNEGSPLAKLEGEFEQALMAETDGLITGLTFVAGRSLATAEQIAQLNESKPDVIKWEQKYFNPPKKLRRNYSAIGAGERFRYVLEVNFELWLDSAKGGYNPRVIALSRMIDTQEEEILARHMAIVDEDSVVHSVDEYSADNSALALREWRNLLPQVVEETLNNYRNDG